MNPDKGAVANPQVAIDVPLSYVHKICVYFCFFVSDVYSLTLSAEVFRLETKLPPLTSLTSFSPVINVCR